MVSQTRSQPLVDWRMCSSDVSFKHYLRESTLHTFLMVTYKQQSPNIMSLCPGEIGARGTQGRLPEFCSVYPKRGYKLGRKARNVYSQP